MKKIKEQQKREIEEKREKMRGERGGKAMIKHQSQKVFKKYYNSFEIYKMLDAFTKELDKYKKKENQEKFKNKKKNIKSYDFSSYFYIKFF